MYSDNSPPLSTFVPYSLCYFIHFTWRQLIDELEPGQRIRKEQLVYLLISGHYTKT